MRSLFPADPRIYQITMLAGLLGYGVLALGFDVKPLHAITIVTTALLTQLVCTRVWRLPTFDPKSALISALSLCLLLRANEVGVVAAAAAVAVASKFLLRWNGKHVFNPTNLALALALLTKQAWVSPGQWGNAAILAFLFGCIGMLVVYRAARSDVTLAFFASYAVLLCGRSLWLGEPLTIPFHRLESGALLLFGFFMISDPRTTPDSRAGRMVFAALVAFGAWYIQFRLFRTNGLLWSLVGVSMLTPLLDWLFRGARYQWPTSRFSTLPTPRPA
ncbi:MAG: RnfABCDGE type electron transport complex subunit D [Pseudomonadota bacterium]|nr:RnfABCDGE type electron transport complex subunit D [Pseudomonadota bacterium]